MTTQKKIVFVVEDEAPLRNALVAKLEHEGFLTMTAKNGADCFEMAVAHKPDLILLDIVMPVMGGMEAMKKLRAESEWGKHVPIILLTNLSPDSEDVMRFVTEQEPSFYLVKSNWKIEDVVEKVRERLGVAA